jgi:hypothetical protein
VSLRWCAQTGGKLADNATCGARCSEFPGCLPAISPELAHQVARTVRATVDEHQAAAAVVVALEELDAAITKGLTRRVASEQSRPRW